MNKKKSSLVELIEESPAKQTYARIARLLGISRRQFNRIIHGGGSGIGYQKYNRQPDDVPIVDRLSEILMIKRDLLLLAGGVLPSRIVKKMQRGFELCKKFVYLF